MRGVHGRAHSASVHRCLAALALVLAVAITPSGVAPQVTSGADLTIRSLNIWRGGLLTEGWTMSPRAWSGWRRLSVGGWALLEPGARQSTHAMVRGARQTFPSQLDLWGEVKLPSPGTSLSAGVLWHSFQGDSLGIPGSANGAELYVELSPPSRVPVVESFWYRARYFHGVRAWETRYAEVELGRQYLVLPIQNLTFTPRVAAGYSFARNGAVPPFDPSRPRSLAQAAISGTLSFSERCDHSRWTWMPDVTGSLLRRGPSGPIGAPAADSRRIRVVLEATWWPSHCASNR